MEQNFLNCDGWVLDYCTSGNNLLPQDKAWKEPKRLCDRHYKIWKEASGRPDQKAS